MKKRLKTYIFPSNENEYKPHIFRGISTVVLLVVIVLVLLASVSSTLFVERSGLLSAIYPSVLVDLANEARIKESQKPLKINEKLVQAAQMKANDMAKNSYFEHTSPGGLSPWYWIGLSGYQFLYAGENLAVDFYFSKSVNKAWLESPGHAANILSPNFTEVGIATSEGVFEGRETIFVVQMFGTPVPAIPTKISETGDVAGSKIETEKSTAEQKVVIVEEITTERESLIVAKDTKIDEEVVIEQQSAGVVEPTEAPGYEKYSNWYDWIILNPAKSIEYALYVATGLVALFLLLMIFINIRLQHFKNIVFGIVILVVLSITIYLNNTGILAEFVSRYFI